MTRKLILFAMIIFILAGSVRLAAQNPDQTPSPTIMKAIEASFPVSLWHKPPSEEDLQSKMHATCAAVYSRKADGTPEYVVASYNGDNAEVAMLVYESEKAHIIDTVTDRDFFLGGQYCDVAILNLADSEHPSSLLEKTVALSYNGQDWYFLWNGKKLANITALYHDDPPLRAPNSAMSDSKVVDIDHRGAMQIVGNKGDYDKFPQEDGISASGTNLLFRYNGKTYTQAKTFLYLREYVPNLPKSDDELALYKTDSAMWTQEIAMHQAPAPSYQLKILNGNRDGSNRVTSAKVEVNGVTVVSSAEINKGVETLTRTIQLQRENKIKVTVDGPEESHMYITVE